MNNSDFINDIFNAYKHSSDYKDKSMMEIMTNKKKFEQNLDEMWNIYSRGKQQIIEYNKGINQVKEAGLKVLRNSSGKHKIVYK